MKRSQLSHDVIEKLWEMGLAGKRLYVPKQKEQTLVASFIPKVLKEVEAAYEEGGVTFYWEASPRHQFSGRFGKSKIASKFNLKLRTAASIVSAAYKAWREWFSHKERLKLEQLRDLAEEASIDYSSLFFTYLAIRKQLRRGEEVQADEHTGYHQVQAHVIQPVIELARASIESCPWRGS